MRRKDSEYRLIKYWNSCHVEMKLDYGVRGQNEHQWVKVT